MSNIFVPQKDTWYKTPNPQFFSLITLKHRCWLVKDALTGPPTENQSDAVCLTARKLKTYTQLAIDLEEKGYKVFLMPFEVISSGHITRTCKTNVENTLRQFRIKVKNSLYIDMAKIALLCTMSVFHAYQVKEWVSPPLLSPWPTLTYPDLPCWVPTLWTLPTGVDCPAARRWNSTVGFAL